MNIPNRASRHQARRASRSWRVSPAPETALAAEPDPEREERDAAVERLIIMPAKTIRVKIPRMSSLLLVFMDVLR
jgi:uncharacterized protein YcgI (DUF1989 family)